MISVVAKRCNMQHLIILCGEVKFEFESLKLAEACELEAGYLMVFAYLG